jgi:Tol biopolymer transport system component
MSFKFSRGAKAGGTLATILLAGVTVLTAVPAAAVDFAHPAFKRVWDRTDSLVASGQVSRTWFWGPEPKAAAQEQYIDAPGGTQTRLVQYFDKSRMEINDPNADPNAIFFVTNGLLTIELISGQMQIGNNAFVNRYSAELPISGDSDDTQAPTYASFLAVSNTRRGDHPQPNRVGQFATNTINKAGQVGDDPSKANVPGTKIAYFEPGTRHNIPERFWGFLNASGPVSETGQIVNKRLIDPWFYASGLPISDPYWSKVKIKGVLTDVMIQAFERRVLTYVPTNVPGFEVEMGNIGLHYYDWRYKDAGKPTGTPSVAATNTMTGTLTVLPTTTPPGGGTPQATATATVTGTPPTVGPTATGTPPTATPSATATINVVTQGAIVFVSSRSGNKDIWRIKGDGTLPTQLTNVPQDDDWPVYSPDSSKIAFVSKRDGNDEIYVMNADGSGATRLTNDPASDTQPTWNLDGTKIAFVSTRGSIAEDIFVMNSNGTGVTNITQIAGKDEEPSWGANNKIVFSSNRSGTRQIYTMNPDGSGVFGPATTSGQNYSPKWNHLGNRIAFVSDRDGNPEIYTMRQGGEEQFRATNNAGNDFSPAYAPNSSKIVFSSNRLDPANYELYTMNVDGSSPERITIEATLDDHPSWGVFNFGQQLPGGNPTATATPSAPGLPGRR